MTCPKTGSDELRVILDLSFPKGSRVNGGIPKERAPFKLRLPSPLQRRRMMLALGKGCKLFKIDLSRAYRQLRSDLLDWPLLGIELGGGGGGIVMLIWLSPLACAMAPLPARGSQRRQVRWLSTIVAVRSWVKVLLAPAHSWSLCILVP